jgi:hypothetical protein
VVFLTLQPFETWSGIWIPAVFVFTFFTGDHECDVDHDQEVDMDQDLDPVSGEHDQEHLIDIDPVFFTTFSLAKFKQC